ncbi:MAG: BlaI/MecI/CopY family transcriptional regulator [Lachnospiraceae bacterium]|nr:BlaI/MecI/CopY family transcriptional regulator [Lachnospiraceae bacterium]
MLRGLADCELDVMQVLWDFGGTTEQKKIKKELERRKGREYSRPTVSTWLLRLKKRKLVEGFVKSGTSFYRPLVTREEYMRLELRILEKRLFGADSFSLVAAFADMTNLTEGDMQKIEDMLRDWDK